MLRGADIGSDHMLVVSRLRLNLRRVVKESAGRKLDLDKLKDPKRVQFKTTEQV